MNKSSKFVLFFYEFSGLSFIVLGALLLLSLEIVTRLYFLCLFTSLFIYAVCCLMLYLTGPERADRLSNISVGGSFVINLVTAVLILLNVFFVPGLIHFVLAGWLLANSFILFMNTHIYHKKNSRAMFATFTCAVLLLFAVPFVLLTQDYEKLQFTVLGLAFLLSGAVQCGGGVLNYISGKAKRNILKR